MDIASRVVLVIHMLGWAIVLGGTLTHLRTPKIAAGVTHGALTALVAGIVLVGLAEMGDGDVNHVKVGIKLLVTLVIAGLTLWGARNEDKVTSRFLLLVAGLTTANIAIAVLWR